MSALQKTSSHPVDVPQIPWWCAWNQDIKWTEFNMIQSASASQVGKAFPECMFNCKEWTLITAPAAVNLSRNHINHSDSWIEVSSEQLHAMSSTEVAKKAPNPEFLQEGEKLAASQTHFVSSLPGCNFLLVSSQSSFRLTFLQGQGAIHYKAKGLQRPRRLGRSHQD